MRCSCTIGILCDEARQLGHDARVLWEKYSEHADKEVLKQWREASNRFNRHLADARQTPQTETQA